jgi:hypothetical protein
LKVALEATVQHAKNLLRIRVLNQLLQKTEVLLFGQARRAARTRNERSGKELDQQAEHQGCPSPLSRGVFAGIFHKPNPVLSQGDGITVRLNQIMEQAATKLPQGRVGQCERLARAAMTHAGEAANQGLIFHSLGAEEFADGLLRQGLEINDLASGDNGRQQALRISADQEQYGAWRRLLQCLEKAIGRFLVEMVGIVKDGHLAPAARRFQSKLLAELPHDRDRQLQAFLRPACREKIGMRACRNLHAGRAAIARFQALSCLCLAEQCLGQFFGKEPLADAGRSGEEIGMSEPAALHDAFERSNLGLMPAHPLPRHGPPPDKYARARLQSVGSRR